MRVLLRAQQKEKSQTAELPEHQLQLVAPLQPPQMPLLMPQPLPALMPAAQGHALPIHAAPYQQGQAVLRPQSVYAQAQFGLNALVPAPAAFASVAPQPLMQRGQRQSRQAEQRAPPIRQRRSGPLGLPSAFE